MTTLRTAAQQALEAWDGGDTEWFKRAYSVMDNLRAALAQQEEPVAWADKISFEDAMKTGKGHDVWPKAGDYETRTGRALIGLYTAPPQRLPQTIDEAMRLPRAMAQAYEAGYKAGQVHERELVIQFLQEMQRVVGEAHNHYGVAAVRIKERI